MTMGLFKAYIPAGVFDRVGVGNSIHFTLEAFQIFLLPTKIFNFLNSLHYHQI